MIAEELCPDGCALKYFEVCDEIVILDIPYIKDTSMFFARYTGCDLTIIRGDFLMFEGYNM